MSLKDERATVSFGGQDYTIEAFCLDDLQIVGDLLDEFFKISSQPDGIKKSAPVGKKIIAMALRQNEDDVGKAGTNYDEIWQVVEAAARITGQKKLGERLRAEMESQGQSTGTTSTPNS